MTVAEFIAKWRKVELTERSAAQQHFLDLCEVFEHPKPAEADPAGSTSTGNAPPACRERGRPARAPGCRAVLAACRKDAAAMQVAATSGIRALLERGVAAVRQLDPIVRNKFSADPAALGAWKSASHIERPPKRTPDSPTPPAQP